MSSVNLQRWSTVNLVDPSTGEILGKHTISLEREID